MSKREEKAFKAWVEEYVDSINDEDARDAFLQFVETDAGLELYRGTLRENDYYTKLNQLNAEKQELQKAQQELADWWENEQPIRDQLIKERDELKQQGGNGVGDNPPSAVTGITSEELAHLRARAAKVDALDKVLPDIMGQYGAALMDAQRQGFEVDANEIMQVSMTQGIPPYRAYEMLTSDQRRARAEAAHKEEQRKWFEEGRRAAMSGESPDHIQPSGPSIYDYLNSPEPESTKDMGIQQRSQSRVSEAVRHFREQDF